MNSDFNILHGYQFVTSSLHCHDEYEIFIFEEGDSKYFVEGKEYSLCPYDIIVIRKHEMHHVQHNSTTTYKRSVITVKPEFFQTNNCPEYEKVFLSDSINHGNKISAKTVMSSGLYDAFYRIKKYSKDFKELNSPVVLGVMLEILYIINEISVFEKPDTINYPVKNIMNYINNHITDKITLDSLCNEFFISKYHLCRMFKKSTGSTIHQYIEQKRLDFAKTLIKNGQGKSESALQSGFADYHSFYRAYTKQKQK